MTATALSFSKNTVFVDAPPTGAPAGRFDKLEPSPINEDAVRIPVKLALPIFDIVAPVLTLIPPPSRVAPLVEKVWIPVNIAPESCA